MKERLIATWPNSTCWVLKIEFSFHVCWNCWWVLNWSWSKYHMTSWHTSFNVFLHNMILRTRKKNSDVWLWFRCWYACQRTLVSRHHGTVGCFRNSVTFHNIDIFMPETNINSSWTFMVGFGYFSWLGFGLFQRRTVHFKGVYLQVVFLQKTAHFFLPVSWPTSTSIFARRLGKSRVKQQVADLSRPPIERWWFTNYLYLFVSSVFQKNNDLNTSSGLGNLVLESLPGFWAN